jgi:hypothetical protein
MLSLLIPSLSRDEARGSAMQPTQKTGQPVSSPQDQQVERRPLGDRWIAELLVFNLLRAQG